MEDLQKIKEFFSNPLKEISKEDAWKEFQEKRHVTDKTASAAKRDFDKGWEEGKFRDGNYKNISESDYSPMGYAKKVANGEMSIEDARKESDIPYHELADLVKKINPKFKTQVKEEEDPTDIIAMDVPLFIRMLEYAREDAETDIDLHDVAERAIEATKLRGLLSMEDYESIIGNPSQVDEIRLVPKDQIETIAAKLAAQIFSKKQDIRPAIDIFKKAVEDSYRALDPDVEIREDKKLTYNDFVRMVRDDMMAGAAPDERPSEELVGKRAKAYYNEYLQGASLDDIFEAEGYSKFLKDDPEFPGGKTKGLTPDTLNKILMKIVQDIDETKQLGENLNEELCPKGKAYIKKRMAAGEKSSAYLSGRAVKVCKGQMKG